MRREKLNHKSFKEFLSDLNSDIENKIISLSPGDCVHFPISYRRFPPSEEYDAKISEYLKQFEYKNFYGETNLFYEQIKSKFEEYLDPLSHKSLHNLLEKYATDIKMKREIINERINSPFTLKNNFLQFNEFQKRLLSEEMETRTLLLKLTQSESKLLDSEKQFIRNVDDYIHLNYFPLESFYEIFRLSSLTHKKEIVSLAISRLDEDNSKYSDFSFPTFPESADGFIDRLKILSSELNIDFDIDLHDGHHFFYSCDKSFSDIFRSHIIPSSIDPPPTLGKNPSMKEIFQSIIFENIKTESIIARKLADISSSNAKDVNDIYSDERFVIKRTIDIREEILACWQKLSFIRNRILLHKIITTLQEINTVKYKIHRQELPQQTLPTIPGYSAFRRQFITNVNQVYHFVKNPDLDLVIQISLESELKFLQSKLKFMNILHEISLHSFSNDVLFVCDKVFSHRPDTSFYLEGKITSFERVYSLEADTYEVLSKVFGTLISMQKAHRKINDKDNFSDTFEIMSELSILTLLFKDEEGLCNEICDTLMIKNEKYREYITFGIWNSFMNQMKSFQGDTFYPFDFLQTDFNIKGFEGCADTFEAQLSYHAMQNQLISTKVLLPYYNTQASNHQKPPNDELAKPSHREQYFYNLQLRTAIRYNNYSTEGNFTHSFNHNEMFYDFLPETNLFASVEDDTILNAMRVDMAFMMTMEMIFSHQNGNQNTLKHGKFYNNDIIEPFANLTLEDCLTMNCNEKIVKICLLRTRLLYFYRFTYSGTQRHEKVFEQVRTDSFNNGSSIVQQITRDMENEKKDVDSVLHYLETFEDIELLKLTLSILIPSIDQIENPKAAVEKIIGRRPNSKNGSVEGPVREMYSMIVSPQHYEKRFVCVNRFIPIWALQYMFVMGDNARTYYQEGTKKLDDMINDAMIKYKTNKLDDMKLVYLKTLYSSNLLRLAFFEISSGILSKDLNSLSVFLNYKGEHFTKGSFFTEKLTKTKSIKPIEGDVTKIKENEATIEKFRIFITEYMRNEQIDQIDNEYEKMADEYQKSLNLGSPTFRPEIYSRAVNTSAIKKTVFFLPDPKDLTFQFNLEKSYNICKLITIAQECSIAYKTGDGLILVNKLKEKLLPLSQRIYDDLRKSAERFSSVWPSTLAGGLNIYDTNLDDVLRCDCYMRKLARDYSGKMQMAMADTFEKKYYELNNLLATLKLFTHDNKHFERKTEAETREYYTKVLTELQQEIEARKKNFGSVHEEFFGVALNTLSDLLTGEERIHQVVKEHKFKVKPADPIAAVKEEIKELEVEILKQRVANCIRQIGMKRVFDKKKNVLVDDRRQYNSLLWGGKHRLEEELHELQTDLLEGEKKLVLYENTIEELQNEIKTVVHENTMLSHIKDMLTLKTRDLNEDLEPLVDVDEEELNDILTKIANANNELEDMRDEHEQYEEQVEIHVREPIAELDRLRRKLVTAKSQSVRSGRISPRNLSPEEEMTILEQRIQENKDLKKENEELKTAIEFLKTQIVEKEEDLPVPRLNIPKTANDLYGRLNAPLTAKRSARNKKIVKPQTYLASAKSARI